MGKLFDLLDSIIAKVKKTEKSIPKKLSDLENDLWYTKKEQFLTLTETDFVQAIIYEQDCYLYQGANKLDWLISAASIGIEVSAVNPDTGEAEVTPLTLTGYEKIGEDCVVFSDEFPIEVYSGLNPVDETFGNDMHSVLMFAPYGALGTFTMTIYKVDEKKIPIEYCDTSEIEAEIAALIEEVNNL